ncbi:MAG TPA: hypothetical protein VFA80_11535 [Xanthobacteraceae bacterium]|nr:hypothetical protein [Xanthobacteraceae bacterium]
MFRAIVSGKGHAIDTDMRAADTWRSLFRRSEDLLSAVVLTRLSYLDDLLLWRLLQKTFRPDLLPDSNSVRLEGFTFWPRWSEASERLGQNVEPDAVFEFSLDNPSDRIVLVLEAKLGGSQTARQWALEWMAYQDEADHATERVFIAGLVGFSAGRLSVQLRDLTADANEIISRIGDPPELRALGADWSDLASSIAEASITSTPADQRILKDLGEALALHGYRHVESLATLRKDAKHLLNLSSPSNQTFKSWADVSVPVSMPIAFGDEDSWLARTKAFRPIRVNHSTITQRWMHE